VGTAQVTATATATAPTTRVFGWKQGPDKKQKIAIPGTETVPLTAAATAQFTPKPAAAPVLPVTGSSSGGLIVAGLLLFAGGALALLAVRRRRIRFTA
jgi:LPXTG-motif cell wall-anchored protein